MRILADENIPGAAVVALRAASHDVSWVCTEFPGVGDEHVLEAAARERRVVVTCDKDFGELAFHSLLPAQSGVVLCRLSSDSPTALADRLVAALQTADVWQGRFSVIEDDRIRSTELPDPDTDSKPGTT